MRIEKAKIRYPERSAPTLNKITRPSIFTDSFREEILNIQLHKLKPYSKQARQSFDDESLQNMAQTIKSHGIRQPLTVIPSSGENGEYEVVSGERRLRAARMAGLERVPCRIINNAKDAAEIAIIENLQREDLHPIEIARSLNSLLEEGICKDYKEICEKVGMSKSVVNELLTYLTIPVEEQNEIIKSKISTRSEIRKIKYTETKEERLKLIQKYSNQSPSVSRPSNNSTNLKKQTKANKQTRRQTVFSVVLENGELRYDLKKANLLSSSQKRFLLERIKKLLTDE